MKFIEFKKELQKSPAFQTYFNSNCRDMESSEDFAEFIMDIIEYQDYHIYNIIKIELSEDKVYIEYRNGYFEFNDDEYEYEDLLEILEEYCYIITVDVKSMLKNDNRKIYPYLSGKYDGKYLAQYYKEELLSLFGEKFVVFKFPQEVLGVNASFIDGFWEEYKSFAAIENDLYKYFRFEGNDGLYEEFIEELKYIK